MPAAMNTFLRLAVVTWLAVSADFATRVSAAELALLDGRRLVLPLSDGWTIERKDTQGFHAFVLRHPDGKGRLTCNFLIAPVPLATGLSAADLQRGDLLDDVRKLGGNLGPKDLINLKMSQGSGFYGVFVAAHERIIQPMQIASGRIVLPTDDVVRFTIVPCEGDSEIRAALLVALANVAILGERDPSIPKNPEPLMREITVMVSFQVQPDGTAGEMYITESSNPDFNDRALALVRGRALPRAAIGRRMLQPVVFRVEEAEFADEKEEAVLEEVLRQGSP